MLPIQVFVQHHKSMMDPQQVSVVGTERVREEGEQQQVHLLLSRRSTCAQGRERLSLLRAAGQ